MEFLGQPRRHREAYLKMARRVFSVLNIWRNEYSPKEQSAYENRVCGGNCFTAVEYPPYRKNRAQEVFGRYKPVLGFRCVGMFTAYVSGVFKINGYCLEGI